MNKYLLILLVGFGIFSTIEISAQTFRGKVVDERKQPLHGATVFLQPIKKGAYSHDDGSFSIQQLPAGKYEMKVSYIGYHTTVQAK